VVIRSNDYTVCLRVRLETRFEAGIWRLTAENNELPVGPGMADYHHSGPDFLGVAFRHVRFAHGDFKRALRGGQSPQRESNPTVNAYTSPLLVCVM